MATTLRVHAKALEWPEALSTVEGQWLMGPMEPAQIHEGADDKNQKWIVTSTARDSRSAEDWKST